MSGVLFFFLLHLDPSLGIVEARGYGNIIKSDVMIATIYFLSVQCHMLCFIHSVDLIKFSYKYSPILWRRNWRLK